ncbi:MAG: hypothetical protein ACXWZS_14165 [Gemmatirosa sp.]
MRVSLNLRALFAAVALFTVAAAPLSARPVTPAPSDTVIATSPSAKWVGVYRLTLAEKDGAMLDTRVLIEANGAQLVGMLLVDQHASGLTDVRIEDESLVARVVTAEGKGTLTLRTTDDGITGALKIGKRVWTVTGVRAI